MNKPKIIVTEHAPRRSDIETLMNPTPMPKWKPLKQTTFDSEMCGGCSGTIVDGQLGLCSVTPHPARVDRSPNPSSSVWRYAGLRLLSLPKFIKSTGDV